MSFNKYKAGVVSDESIGSMRPSDLNRLKNEDNIEFAERITRPVSLFGYDEISDIPLDFNQVQFSDREGEEIDRWETYFNPNEHFSLQKRRGNHQQESNFKYYSSPNIDSVASQLLYRYVRILESDDPRFEEREPIMDSSGNPYPYRVPSIYNQRAILRRAVSGDDLEDLKSSLIEDFEQTNSDDSTLDDVREYYQRVEQVMLAGIANKINEEGWLEDAKRAWIDEKKIDAQQLDWVAFPPDKSSDEIFAEIKADSDKQQASGVDINFSRLDLLRALHAEYDGAIYRTKSDSLGGESPYYVLETYIDGKKIAIAETPMRNNATYIVDEGSAAGTWQEVFQLSKKDAKVVGAKYVVHPEGDDGHDEKVSRALQEILM